VTPLGASGADRFEHVIDTPLTDRVGEPSVAAEPGAGRKDLVEPVFTQAPIAGLLDEAGHARGRPVGVALDMTGALLVADDVGGVVWRVTAARPSAH